MPPYVWMQLNHESTQRDGAATETNPTNQAISTGVRRGSGDQKTITELDGPDQDDAEVISKISAPSATSCKTFN